MMQYGWAGRRRRSQGMQTSGTTRRIHPWADRLNAIKKYVFSSTLERAEWNNSAIVRGDVTAEVTKLKEQDGGDLLVYGHGLLAETIFKQHLLDVLDISIYPCLRRFRGVAVP